MRRIITLAWIVSFAAVLTVGVLTQDADTCPAIASDALAAVDSLCEETGRS